MHWLKLIENNSWNKARETILSYREMKERDDPNTDIPKKEIIEGAIDLVEAWQYNIQCPNVVYLLPDGNILLEWNVGQKTLRLEIEGRHSGEMMVSAPNEETEFYPVTF